MGWLAASCCGMKSGFFRVAWVALWIENPAVSFLGGGGMWLLVCVGGWGLRLVVDMDMNMNYYRGCLLFGGRGG